MIAQHSSETNEHYTPLEYIEAARRCMGGIDLDPASCGAANEIVRAAEYMSAARNGFSLSWHGRVWLNPPGGLCDGRGITIPKDTKGAVGRQSSQAAWWSKLVDEYQAGHVTEAVFLGFTLEILRLGQSAKISPLEVPFCVPRERIRFLDSDLQPQKSPTHTNVLLYLGPYPQAFAREFGHFGHCVI